MSMMGGLDLNATVDADVNPYLKDIERAQAATYRYETSLQSLDSQLRALEKQLDDDLAAALDRQHDAMTNAGQGVFLFGAAVAAGLGLAANEAIKWESSWAGVTKTVDGTEEELAQLEDELRQLATSLPATHEEIAAIAEAAGQLGVERDSVAAFTKTMVDLAETTDLTGDQAATSIAQLMNIMQTAPEDVGRVGAALVALGNDGASTESQIVQMAQRIAGAGAQLGLAEGEVLAIANALASVGVEVEAGGSAISTVMKEIQLDVSTNAARLEDWAAVAGMSAEQFKSLWEADAAAGLNAFVTGLGDIQASGGDAIKTLADLEVTQVRQSDALLRLAGSGDMLTDSLELGNQAWEENTALLEEAAKRYETTESKVAIARNQLRDTAIDVGEVLVPAIAAVAGVTANMLRAWQDLPDPLKTGAVLVGALAAAVALLGGAALIAVPKIAAFNTAVAGLEAGALKTAGTRLSGLASVLMGPWGVALAGATAVLMIFAAEHGKTVREVEALKVTLDDLGNVTEDTYAKVLEQLSSEGWLQYAEDMGISMDMVVAAVTEGGSALDELEARVREQAGSEWNPFNADAWTNDASQFIGNIESARDRMAEAEDQGKATAAGLEALGDKTGAAGDAQEGTTAAWEDGAGAAGELTEEVKTLGEEISELSENYLSNRDAGRAVRGTLREIEDALKAYREEHDDLDGAFKTGTESGDEFAAMLDDLAEDYQRQIQATEELYGSEKRTMAAYREARSDLRDVAEQLGMTEREARNYIDTVLGTPEEARTHFSTPGMPQALSDAAELNRILELAARDRQARIDVTVAMHHQGYQTLGGLQEADGGIVEAYADGGFSGRYVDRVPQLRTGGGRIVWNEPETGWEAYISGKPGMRARNREVWSEAGRRLGFTSGGGHQVAVDLGDLHVTGTLQTPWGPAEVAGIARGVAREEIHAEASFQGRQNDRD